MSALRLAALAAACALAAVSLAAAPARNDRWSRDERAQLAALQLTRLGPPPADPSNAVADRPEAAALGRRLFADTRLSADGRVACASCHAPDAQFEDGRPLGQGIATGARRTMPVVSSAHAPWLFWDGRKDSLWSQALGPLEDAAEHGTTRLQVVRVLHAEHRGAYEALFGPLPALDGLPADAGPLGTPAQRAAWERIPAPRRMQIDRAFANAGKAIAAWERRIGHGEARVDRYVRAVLDGDANGLAVLAADEVAGLRLFVGKGQCSTCHNGPLMSDHAFHNTGVPARAGAAPDPGRAAATERLQADPFNCLGPHSDAGPADCAELRFLASGDAALLGAFRTPGLRNVALRPPYMHAGQFGTLAEVVAHYARSPAAAIGHSELAHAGGGHAGRAPIRLDAAEQAQLVAFLQTLSGPVVERAAR